MTSNNPITCVSLMVHKEHITMFVHRGDKCSGYNNYVDARKRDQPTRFKRLVKMTTEFLKVSYLQNTGCLAPNKW